MTDTSHTLTTDGWIGHFLMMKRWYYRSHWPLGEHRSVFTMGDLHGRADAFWAFFIACHNLPEYLSDAGYKDASKYAANIEELKVCRDVANQSKHVVLKEEKKPTDVTTKGLRTVIAGLWRDPSDQMERTVMLSNFYVVTDSKKYDVDVLARECMDAWARYLKQHNVEMPMLHEEIVLKNFPTYECRD